MKVSELTMGMLLKPVGDGQVFHVADWGHPYGWQAEQRQKYGEKFITKYLVVRTKSTVRKRKEDTESFAMYLGTKKELDVYADWVNKFVLIDNQIVGVDPTAWRQIMPANLENL